MITRELRYLSLNDVGKSIDFHASCHPMCSAYGPLEKIESLDSTRAQVTVWGEKFVLPLNILVTITGKKEKSHGTE